MKTRLAKFIADSGFASRREAEKLITDGVVSVNGKEIDTPVFFVEQGDKVTINGISIRNAEYGQRNTKVYAFHKPVDTMTTARDPNGRTTIYDVLPEKYRNLKYIGRLDYKTTGLLLLTDDGALARELTLPASGIRRTYIAKLRPESGVGNRESGVVNKSKSRLPTPDSRSAARRVREFLSPLSADDSIFDPLRHGVTIGGMKYAPMEIEMLSRYPLTVKIILTEGKKNEIRIAFDYIGLPVSKLRRIAYGSIEIGNLPPGGIRELSENEIKSLKS